MKLIATLFLFISFILTNQLLFAQAPVVEWQKCLGGFNGDYANSIIQTSDGGYIVTGVTEGTDNADVMGYHGNPYVQDYWVVKMTSSGNIQWQKCLGGLYGETGGYIRQTPDGGYIVAGSSASIDCDITGNHGGHDYWLVKLNDKGDIVWQKMIGGSRNDHATSLDFTSDGGYILAGHSESSDGDLTVNHGNRDFWVVKVNGSGVMQWQKDLGGSSDEEAYSVKATADGGCIVAGYSYSSDGDVTGNHGGRDYWVVKLDNTGSLQWQKSLGGSEFEVAWSIDLSMDGGYIVAGYASSNNGDVSGNHNGLGPGASDFWTVKLNSSGTIQWQKCYGGDKNDIAYFIQSTPDGGYVVAGSAESANGDVTCNSGATDMWIIKISSTGVLQWQKILGGNYYDEAHCIQTTSDGGYIAAGNTCSSDISGWHTHSTMAGSCADFWVVKFAAPAVIPPNPIVTIDPASATVCPGGPSTLTASARFAGTNPTYHWEKNGITVGSNSSSYTASDFSNNDVVKCFVTSGGPCETGSLQASDAVTIMINNNITQPYITIAADDSVICPCTTITFKATVFNGGSSPKYRWYINSVNTGADKDFYISNNLKDGDIVSCSYMDNASCIVAGTVYSNSIRVIAASGQTPTVSINASNNNICSGSPIIFIANTVNAGINPTYQWKINGVNAGANSKTYLSSSLLNGDIVSCTINSDPLFTCIAPASANSNTIAVNLTNALAPNVSIVSSANTICTGSSVTFTATPVNAGTNPTYQWTINGANAGTNANTFTTPALLNGDIVNCKINTDPLFTCATSPTATSNNIAINVGNGVAPSVNISASGNDVCKGTVVSFTAMSVNAGASPTYQWKLNNNNVGGNSPVFSNNNLSNGDLVYCQVIAGNNACSNSNVSSNIITMNINDAPVITIIPNDSIVVSGSQTQLNATVMGTIGSYQWDPANKLVDPLSLTPTTIQLNSNTLYTLNIVSDKGCTSSKNVTIKIKLPLNMPNGFTPNNDGVNDVFRIPKDVSFSLNDFSVFDRWGNKVFSTKNIYEGWNGTYKGGRAVPGVYIYIISGPNEKGNIFLKGSFVLIR